ncbi:N-6 DNA methylase [Methanococcus maripaludis C5]|uniref:site-specific DNA-methyltransferase (adenine-specific) n=2 Tax=Methanococcus maripaludis TaxID=39152 RepID=A4FZ33_METM5|nr:type I restriction-modification system subunit M [Methanococcus maripaludis]ABO35467.1 N-6 DNA methylase [Methanococcus maripaludis C5]MBA2861000.1 type I restriction enzyme M protein [Methanococcus maripaludis]
MLDDTLKSPINKLWDKFWSNGISNPLTAIEQMSYLIFMKRMEDEDIKREQSSRLSGETHVSIFKDNENMKWSKWTNMEGKEMLNHVRDNVFPFLRSLGEKDSLYNTYMNNAVFAIPNASLLVEAVKIVENLHIKEQNRDAKGDLYEYLLSELKTAGKNGQFRTPRHIIKMMVELTDPDVGDKICDPACGTAGFLIAAYEYLLKKHSSAEFIKIDEDGNEYGYKGDKLDSKGHDFLRNETFYGSEFDQTMVRIALMNLMMHGIENPNIFQKNSLVECDKYKGHYNVILANPPFKGSVDKSEIEGNFTTTTTKTELLFLELMYNLLTIGGRCAVIIPDGVLFGNSKAHKQIRERILKNCRLDAVISMPSGVFKPYAGVSTGILIFTKGEPTKKIWFYDMQADGFTLDDKRNKIDGKGDIPDIIERFKNRFNEPNDDKTKKHFFVPVEEIFKNDFDLSLSKYKKINYEEVEYDDPKVIQNRILKLELGIQKNFEELRELMND